MIHFLTNARSTLSRSAANRPTGSLLKTNRTNGSPFFSPQSLIGVAATIHTELIEGGSGDSVEFRDPWLIDFDEPPYGLRNQGMSAPFIANASPFSPSTSSPYNGVFLNQGGPPLWNPPLVLRRRTEWAGRWRLLQLPFLVERIFLD